MASLPILLWLEDRNSGEGLEPVPVLLHIGNVMGNGLSQTICYLDGLCPLLQFEEIELETENYLLFNAYH